MTANGASSFTNRRVTALFVFLVLRFPLSSLLAGSTFPCCTLDEFTPTLMTSVASREIVSAHSPDSDDAFMFYGLATKKVRSSKVTFRHVLEDIETLNRKAMEGQYDLSAISYHAYPYVADKYVLMASGSSIGDGYGPMIIATRPMEPEELKGKRIAVPGTLTTAYLALQAVPAGFRSRGHAVRQDHRRREGAERGRGPDHPRSAVDVRPRGLPPHRRSRAAGSRRPTTCRCRSAANALLRSLDPDVQSECCRMMRESIQYALDNHDEALAYAMQFARDMEQRLAEKFVGMYVNHYTVDAGDVSRRPRRSCSTWATKRGSSPSASNSNSSGRRALHGLPDSSRSALA